LKPALWRAQVTGTAARSSAIAGLEGLGRLAWCRPIRPCLRAQAFQGGDLVVAPLAVVTQDFDAGFDTGVANMDLGPGNEACNLVLALAAERAVERAVSGHGDAPVIETTTDT
jgi:hypothetical protein